MIAPLARRATRLTVALVGLLIVTTACGPRQVEVRTAPQSTDSSNVPTVQLTNNLSQAVNVYVNVSGGAELFLRQVPANTAEKVPVSGVPSGSTVSFKAVTVDGSRTYQSRSAALSPLFTWSVP